MLKMITIGIPSSFMYLKMFIIILVTIATTKINAVDSDIRCLRSIKESLQDPLQRLSNWSFDNTTEGFICRFAGVECWSPDENKVLSLNLSEMGLGGSFPIGLRNCGSMLGLDLSRNHLSGPIPSNLPDVLRFVTSLDLSNNNLSGPIPTSIANCSFISVLNLANNNLTGQIPPQLSLLGRIKKFSVANNKLSGRVPLFHNGNISAKSYANNLGLCGGPLNACEREDHDDLFLAGFAVGFPLYTILTMLFIPSIGKMLLYLHPIKKIEGIPETLVKDESSSDSDKENVKSSLSFSLSCNYMFNTRVIAMEKVTRRLSLREVERATNDFDGKNVIGYGNMGVMYKAMFLNNLQLVVKRLHKFERLEKEFLTEIKILGRLRPGA
ncbi:hypothetical protein OSB04_025654 [Centaurea solstitialis]|uniref:Leucine-rich repeat-containing N-terminal plant-type domain-containing protein n=1 Tax=Centaurea solstitialis TaxID=347529 RepID=A0AA38W1Y0_9ASTR|nr:hypothetical protein OSB04_025654 [Centaurea solstitialis]